VGHNRRRRHQRERASARLRQRRRLISERGRTGHAKGRDNERKLAEALEFLRVHRCILGYFVSSPNDSYDRQGIDAIITFLDRTYVNIGAVSSDKGERRFRFRHPDKTCVNFKGCTHVLDFAQRLIEQFGLPIPEAVVDNDAQ